MGCDGPHDAEGLGEATSGRPIPSFRPLMLRTLSAEAKCDSPPHEGEGGSYAPAVTACRRA